MFDAEKYIGIEFNGYKWVSHYKGVHSFQKRSDDGRGWMLVQCAEAQLSNGDADFMTKHGWTLSKERQKAEHKKFDLLNAENKIHPRKLQ